MITITGKEVFNQLKADLIGKDSYRGVTLTYSWLANQFGHFSLGYIPTLIAYSILKRYNTTLNPAFWGALVISLFWLLFELYNFLGPLLFKKGSQSKLIFIPGSNYTFQPAWGNVAFDTFTDLCFFWFGAFSASLFLLFSLKTVYILIALFLILIYPSKYWFLVKMYLQSAKYPFQFRLSQWEIDMDNTEKKAVNDFLNNKGEGKHLFVYGGRRSGKTSLSVGIATEKSIKQQVCLYTTGIKLYNMFSEPDSRLLPDERSLWTWRTASLLVIDDINPGDPIKEILVTTELFLKMVDAFTPRNNNNRHILKEKNIIWVMGNEEITKETSSGWEDMLLSIGVKKENISSIKLNFSYM